MGSTVNSWLTDLTSIAGSYASMQAPAQPQAPANAYPTTGGFSMSTTEIVVAVFAVVVLAVVIKKVM